jgi:predicted TIM-barrel fold metal-dependent hydrolase
MTIDCAVFPQWRHWDEIREYLARPWSEKPFSKGGRLLYPSPVGDFADVRTGDGSLPGSDPAIVSEDLFDARGVDYAVLVPHTRGLHPDVDLDTAICAATNEWLASRWLEEGNGHGRFRGSIAVCPRNPEEAVKEIYKWASHPMMVQVSVPLQAHQPYGQRSYGPVWAAAAEHGLPVAVRADLAGGVEFWPTAAGYVRHYVEMRSLVSLNSAYHYANLIAEGVFERFPRIRFVFVDGGHDLVAALTHRLDLHWRAERFEMPWTNRLPSEYLSAHVRFVSNRLECPDEDGVTREWARMGAGEQCLLYGSRYPMWDDDPPADAAARYGDALRDAVMHRTAAATYDGIARPVAL